MILTKEEIVSLQDMGMMENIIEQAEKENCITVTFENGEILYFSSYSNIRKFYFGENDDFELQADEIEYIHQTNELVIRITIDEFVNRKAIVYVYDMNKVKRISITKDWD